MTNNNPLFDCEVVFHKQLRYIDKSKNKNVKNLIKFLNKDIGTILLKEI